MERIDKTVFLSYRHTNIPWALAIFQDLTQHGYDVFFDFDGIASGDFEQVILGSITARAHFLVLLTPSALEHCRDPADWLRREIETALANRRNIVPLMLEGFDFGTPEIASQLTGTLAELKRYNGLSIPPVYFSEAMDRLRAKYLNKPLDTVLHPTPLSAQRVTTEQKEAASAAPVVQQDELAAQQRFELGKVRFYTEAKRLKPDYAEAFKNRGAVRQNKGDFDVAEMRRFSQKNQKALQKLGHITGEDQDKSLSELMQDAFRLEEWILSKQAQGMVVVALEPQDLEVLTNTHSVHGKRERLVQLFQPDKVAALRDYFATTAETATAKPAARPRRRRDLTDASKRKP